MKSLFSEALWWSVKLQSSCTALPAAGAETLPDPLESLDDTGNGSAESKNGRKPSDSYCLLSITPFFPSLTEATWQLVAGNAHITEVSMVRNHTELWEILGREVLRAVNGQKHLPAVKPIKMNDDSLFISLSFSGYSAQSVFISRSSHHRGNDFSVFPLSQLLIKSATV